MAKSKLSDDMKRLTRVKFKDVPCPWKGRIHKPDDCREVRKKTARQITAILRAGFEVAERPCNGDAHSNPHIDHCMVCLPNWGVVRYLVPKKVPAS